VTVGRDDSGMITLSFPYDPLLVSSVKTIPGHRWHPIEKYWSFPNSNGTLEKILEAFQGVEIHMDTALQTEERTNRTEQNPTLKKGARGDFPAKIRRLFLRNSSLRTFGVSLLRGNTAIRQ